MNVLVLGAGQLARMMALAVKRLNINIRAFDVGSNQVVDPLSTNVTFGDLAAGIEYADVITAEFEHIDHQTLSLCQASGKLFPSSEAIKTGGDRRIEKALMTRCGVSNAPHKIIECKNDFDEALNTLTLPLIFKSALAGYDGKGQWRLKNKSDIEALWQDISSYFKEAGTEIAVIAEQMIPFDREVSLVGVRDLTGNTKVYPITENHHTDGVLSVSLAIESDDALQEQAKGIFDAIANDLNYVGVLAIEFFQVGEQLLVNEIAPRVHNSGHWTQQGAEVSQFENHIRAVCGLPLGSTDFVRPSAMVNILGEDNVSKSILDIAGVNIHWYGKSKRPGRKMGHINISGATEQVLAEKLDHVADMLPTESFKDLKGFSTNYLQKISN